MRDPRTAPLEAWTSRLNGAKPRALQLLRSLSIAPTDRLAQPAPPLAGGFIPYLGLGLHYGLRGPELLRELHRRHGDVFTLRMLGKHITFCFGREYVEHLYEAPYDEVSFLDGLKLFPGFGTVIRFNSTGPEDANVGLDTLRRFLAPRVHEGTGDLDREVRGALARQAATGKLELRRDLSLAIVQLSAFMLAGPTIARDPAFLADALAFDFATQGMVKGLFSSRPLERAAVSRDRLEQHFHAEIARRRAVPDREPYDLVDGMLAARDPAGRPFSDAQIVSDLVGYSFATTANTPAAATMCLIHILQDADLRARVEHELTSVLTQSGDVLDTAALKRLPLLDACLNETLRVYAPGIHLRMLRRTTRVGRYSLPADALVAVSPYVLHRDSAVYDDPDVFDPDRFLGGPRRPAKKPAALHFVPFGRGLHACVGRTLARAEVLLTVARVLTDLAPALVPAAAPLAVDWTTAGLGVPNRPVHVRVTPAPSVRPFGRAG